MRVIPRPYQARGFNKRAFTFDDFVSICAEMGIKWYWFEGESLGQFFYRRGFPIIILNPKLTSFMLLYVAFHELSHALLHPTGIRYFVRGSRDKFERQAGDLSLCCVLPKPRLRKILLSGPSEEWLYPVEIMKGRCELLTRTGY